MKRDKAGRLGQEIFISTASRKPSDPRFFTKPRTLALGVIPVALLGGGDCLLAGQFTTQDAYSLRVAERGQRTAFVAVPLHQDRSLFHQAALEHLGGSVVDALVQARPCRCQPETQDAAARQRVTPLHPLAGDGLSRGERNLDRPDQLGCVVGMDLGGGQSDRGA